MPRGHGIRTRTSFIIRDWLHRVGKGTITQFYDYLKGDPELKEYDIGSWHTVATLFWLLHRKLELIVDAGTGVGKRKKPIHFYALRKGYERDMAWEDIFKFSYPEDYGDNTDELIYWRMRKEMEKSIDVKTFEKERGKYG